MSIQGRVRRLMQKLEGYDLLAPELRDGQKALLENVLIVALADVRHEEKMIGLDAQASFRVRLLSARHYSDTLARDVKRLQAELEEGRKE